MKPQTGQQRVAIASCHDINNFGSVLQAYATQEFLANCGYDAYTIDKRGLRKAITSNRRNYYIRNLLNFEMYREKAPFALKRIRQHIDSELKDEMGRRNAAFECFSRKMFRYTERAFSFEALSEMSKGFDCVVVGSDQNWLPVNISGGYYTLQWVPSSVKRLSYATSFGVSSLDSHYMGKAQEFLTRFDAISVREESGAAIVERATGVKPKVVCDPTMLLTRNQWLKVANMQSVGCDNPYIFCYFLGRNTWQREVVSRFARNNGMKIVAVSQVDSYMSHDRTYADDYVWDAGPSEWLGLLNGAALVCTDSFHATLFSNLFEKPYVSFRRHASSTKMSTNSRLDTLLTILDHKERLCEDKDDFTHIASSHMSFMKSNLVIERYREESATWLLTAIGESEIQEKTKAVNIVDKRYCCGCSSCVAACPERCITMVYDEEGCEYPYVDHSHCIECGLCTKSCPILNNRLEEPKPQHAYLLKHRDPVVLSQSTSGGAVTAFAQTVIRKGGIVFGAAYLREGDTYRGDGAPGRLKVGHLGIEREDDLWRFRNSKYVQSIIGPTYREVRDELVTGRPVLFIGTPCQCEGLLSFLKDKPSNLFIVDVVCRAVVCRSVFSSYLNWLDSRTEEPAKTVLFRDKTKYGYEYSNLRAISGTDPSSNETLYAQGVESDPYLRAFFSNICDRPSCYECRFKKRYRNSDITCWDCFEADRFVKGFDENLGVTRVLTHSSFGEALLRDAETLTAQIEIPVDSAIDRVDELVNPVSMNPKRQEFMQDVMNLSGVQLFNKWFPDTPRVRIERLFRTAAERLGVYAQAKHIVKAVLKRR